MQVSPDGRDLNDEAYTASATEMGVGFVAASEPYRPLTARGAGEVDFRLASGKMLTGPLSPCVAGEQVSKTCRGRRGSAPVTSVRKNLIHLPGKPAGVCLGP